MEIQIPELINWSTTSEVQRETVLSRPPVPEGDFQNTVSDIISRVRLDGDSALREFGEKYDGVVLEDLEVSDDEWAIADSQVDPQVLQAMDEAISRISAFHSAGKPESLNMETSPGLRCEARYLPISPVGLYVPGGSAPLISTVMMLGVPARIAACEQIVLCTPPDREGFRRRAARDRERFRPPRVGRPPPPAPEASA
jgi:histidinol dehydrogenase